MFILEGNRQPKNGISISEKQYNSGTCEGEGAGWGEVRGGVVVLVGGFTFYQSLWLLVRETVIGIRPDDRDTCVRWEGGGDP